MFKELKIIIYVIVKKKYFLKYLYIKIVLKLVKC